MRDYSSFFEGGREERTAIVADRRRLGDKYGVIVLALLAEVGLFVGGWASSSTDVFCFSRIARHCARGERPRENPFVPTSIYISIQYC